MRFVSVLLLAAFTIFQLLGGVAAQDNQCVDVAPDNTYSCTQQASWGKCNANWMIQGGYCQKTCDRCPDPCVDVVPDCEQLVSSGQCDTTWMIQGNFCQETCNRCSEPGEGICLESGQGNFPSASVAELPEITESDLSSTKICGLNEKWLFIPIPDTRDYWLKHVSTGGFLQAYIEGVVFLLATPQDQLDISYYAWIETETFDGSGVFTYESRQFEGNYLSVDSDSVQMTITSAPGPDEQFTKK